MLNKNGCRLGSHFYFQCRQITVIFRVLIFLPKSYLFIELSAYIVIHKYDLG